tara:strand:+ start:3015 stop:4256 length:1242 start_codon:yes stop_codon:yes gene_type:complete
LNLFKKYFLLIIAGTLLLSCGQTNDKNSPKGYPLILISIDGFRWDYFDKTDTPHFDELIAGGVKAESLIPVFPSKTFPNHYSIVTGLYAENHGIVANRMYDPEFDAWFYIGENSEPVSESRWWEGEPIWVTVEKQNKIAACMFWPGSEAEIQGVRPTYWRTYDHDLPKEDRISQVLAWLDMKEEDRPDFITLYFSDTDSWGHDYGPDAVEMAEVIEEIDESMGALLDSLEVRNLKDKINIIVVSDHGMTELSRERVVFLDDYINLDDVLFVDYSPVAALRPNDEMEDSIYLSLVNAHSNMNVYLKEEIPERLHYRNHRRITPIICFADDGWSITDHSYYDSYPDAFTGGTHGYDPVYDSMHGICIAYGPAFNNGITVPSIKIIHLYSLMAQVMNLQPAETDGSLDSVTVFLAR